MNIIESRSLGIGVIKVVRFARFRDHRGYFTEPYRVTDVANSPATQFLRDVRFVQVNESYSRGNTIRGLHFQWNPFMGKFVRTLSGRMVDLALDIRIGSKTFGSIIAYEMPYRPDADWDEWIWIPPGFAHGNWFSCDSTIEYLCSGEYSHECEAAICPMSPDIDWSLCDAGLASEFRHFIRNSPLISEKDRTALSVQEWRHDPRSENFHV